MAQELGWTSEQKQQQIEDYQAQLQSFMKAAE
jgi:glycerol-3-phosphate dehydrogenase